MTDRTLDSLLSARLSGHVLVTADIAFRMPDRPALLQTFVWQELDRRPSFPRLEEFLDFWEREIDGKVHSVALAWRALPRSSFFRIVEKDLSY